MSEIPASAEPQTVTLVVRRTIHASAERLFEAWTQPICLKEWWGPDNVRCVDAEVDLRVGGGYRIANQFPDGKLVWIVGEFELNRASARASIYLAPGPGRGGVRTGHGPLRAAWWRDRGHRHPRAHPEYCHPGPARRRLAGLPRRPGGIFGPALGEKGRVLRFPHE